MWPRLVSIIRIYYSLKPIILVPSSHQSRVTWHYEALWPMIGAKVSYLRHYRALVPSNLWDTHTAMAMCPLVPGPIALVRYFISLCAWTRVAMELYLQNMCYECCGYVMPSARPTAIALMYQCNGMYATGACPVIQSPLLLLLTRCVHWVCC